MTQIAKPNKATELETPTTWTEKCQEAKAEYMWVQDLVDAKFELHRSELLRESCKSGIESGQVLGGVIGGVAGLFAANPLAGVAVGASIGTALGSTFGCRAGEAVTENMNRDFKGLIRNHSVERNALETVRAERKVEEFCPAEETPKALEFKGIKPNYPVEKLEYNLGEEEEES